MSRLHIEPAGVTVDVQPGQTLLEAALAEGLRLRSACRNGTCRACLAKLLSGTVHYRVEWPGVLPDERAEDWALFALSSDRLSL